MLKAAQGSPGHLPTLLAQLSTSRPHDTTVMYNKPENFSGLRLDWSRLVLHDVVGRGGFGVVHRARLDGAHDVAVKVFDKQLLGGEVQTALLSELDMMRKAPYPSIAKPYGFALEDARQALVMQYYERGSLADALLKPAGLTSFTMTQRLDQACSVAAGIAHLHGQSPPIVHGDLKSGNLLFETDTRLVITDFGLARALRSTAALPSNRPVPLTPSITPLEVWQDPHTVRTRAVDAYAFGVVLLELAQAAPAYNASRSTNNVRGAVLAATRPSIPSYVPSRIAALNQDCWAQAPSRRPPFDDILRRMQLCLDELRRVGADVLV